MMSALFRKSLYFLSLLVATAFILHYAPAFAQQDPGSIKFKDFYPPTAIPTNTKTPTLKPGAPTPTTGNPLTPPANPSISGQPTKKPTAAATITVLVDNIRMECKNGVVTEDTLDCLDEIDPPLASNVKDKLVRSTISFFYLQCVGFVRAATIIVFGSDFSNQGNAIDFATNVPSGYQLMEKYSGKIKVNDIPIWDVGIYGHIAIVSKVYSSNIFQIAEANWGVSGSVQLRNISLSEPNLKGWLRKN